MLGVTREQKVRELVIYATTVIVVVGIIFGIVLTLNGTWK
jgi:hypothetical protein